MAALGATLALPVGASAKPRPAVSLSLARASEGAPISFTWRARHVGHARLVVQRPVGTAHTWKTMLKLSGKRGTGELPGVSLGKYHYRLAALKGRRVLAQAVAGVAVFGQVPFAVLFYGSREHSLNTPSSTFRWVKMYGVYENRGALFSVNDNHCSSVHVAFVETLNEDDYGSPVTLTLVQESQDPVSASAELQAIGALDANLIPGQSWGLNASYARPSGPYEYGNTGSGDLYINGYAVCDSAEMFSGS
jgi:hypothetical protein